MPSAARRWRALRRECLLDLRREAERLRAEVLERALRYGDGAAGPEETLAELRSTVSALRAAERRLDEATREQSGR